MRREKAETRERARASGRAGGRACDPSLFSALVAPSLPGRDRFNPFSISLSKRRIHIYERQESKKDSRAPSPTCKVRACKYLRGHVHTFQPFIDLLTRRHRRPSFFSVLLSFSFYITLSLSIWMCVCVCVTRLRFLIFPCFFSYRRYCVEISKESAARLSHNRASDGGDAGLDKPRAGSANFVITRDKGESTDNDRFAGTISILVRARASRQPETFIEVHEARGICISIVNSTKRISHALPIGRRDVRASLSLVLSSSSTSKRFFRSL